MSVNFARLIGDAAERFVAATVPASNCRGLEPPLIAIQNQNQRVAVARPGGAFVRFGATRAIDPAAQAREATPELVADVCDFIEKKVVGERIDGRAREPDELVSSATSAAGSKMVQIGQSTYRGGVNGDARRE